MRRICTRGRRNYACAGHDDGAPQKERAGFRIHERISPYPSELAVPQFSSTHSRVLWMLLDFSRG
jgi:hypothetical protein